MEQVQVQLRVPKEVVSEIDKWVGNGRFASRSDAIKSIVTLYEEREKTREFGRMLIERSEQARRNPKKLVQLK